MKGSIVGLILLSFGCVLILFRKQFAVYNAKFQRDNFKILLDSKNNDATEKSALFVGLFSIIVGLLTMLGMRRLFNVSQYTENTVWGCIFIAIGILQIVFIEKFHTTGIDGPSKAINVRIGRRAVNIIDIVIIVFSLALIMTGVWSLIKV